MNTHTIAHTTWNCKYHVVFAPKYRRKAFYGGRRLEMEQYSGNYVGGKE